MKTEKYIISEGSGYDPISMTNWFRIGLFNLFIVALYGVTMRYKIAYDFPFLQQKNLLHAHSHFAFSGWISHFLYTALLPIIQPFLKKQQLKKYDLLLLANLVCSFGMLIAFSIQGYKLVSISFSIATIIVAVFYAYFFISDSKKLPSGTVSKPWAIMGVLLNVLSSLGPLWIAYMIAGKNINQDVYLGSVYFYLHFQYSGWFFFAMMAVVVQQSTTIASVIQPYFKYFALAVVPTFFLSILWANLPVWLYILTVAATLLQLGGWIFLIKKYWQIRRRGFSMKHHWHLILFGAAALSMTLKFILQAVSVLPALSQLVFGFRPIVIAYLHLVLLGVYTLFIIGYLFNNNFIPTTKATKAASGCFLLGVILNQSFLAIQGIAAFNYIPIPYINQLLLSAAIVLCGSAAWLFILYKGRKYVYVAE